MLPLTCEVRAGQLIWWFQCLVSQTSLSQPAHFLLEQGSGGHWSGLLQWLSALAFLICSYTIFFFFSEVMLSLKSFSWLKTKQNKKSNSNKKQTNKTFCPRNSIYMKKTSHIYPLMYESLCDWAEFYYFYNMPYNDILLSICSFYLFKIHVTD